jgi:hypothetical protein
MAGKAWNNPIIKPPRTPSDSMEMINFKNIFSITNILV